MIQELIEIKEKKRNKIVKEIKPNNYYNEEVVTVFFKRKKKKSKRSKLILNRNLKYLFHFQLDFMIIADLLK